MSSLPSKIEWIKLFKQAVMHSPIVRDENRDQELKHMRPQSFSVIEYITELSSANNMIDAKNKDYSFNRNAAIRGNNTSDNKVGWPNVSFYSRTDQFDNVFSAQESIEVVNAKIFVVDIVKKSASGVSPDPSAQNRHFIEITEDCKAIADWILFYISNVQFYTWEENSVNKSGWLNSGYANYLSVNNKVQNLVLDSTRQIFFKNKMREKNRDLLIRAVREESAHALYGIQFDINLPCERCLFQNEYGDFNDYEFTVRG